MKDYPETDQKGVISFVEPVDLGIQIAKDDRVWVCINGTAFLRFKPSLIKIDGKEAHMAIKEKVVCSKCGAEYTDEDSIKMVKEWLAKGSYAPCPNLDCFGNMKLKHTNLSIKGAITQRQPDGSIIGIEFHGVVDTLTGDINKAAEVIIQAEMHGNDGPARVHLFLE